MAARDVLVVDPGNYTPYYDVNLCHALVERGWRAEWWTSPYLFEPIAVPSNVARRELFLRGPAALMRRLPWTARIRGLRRGLKALSYPFDLMRLDRELEARPAGVLHVQWALLPPLDAHFWRRWQARGWKIVHTAHDVDGLDGTTPRLLRTANRRLFGLADAVVAHSARDEARIVGAGAAPSRVHRVAQGTPGIFQAAPVGRAEARRTLGLDALRPTILFFGLLKAYKGIGLLLASLATVREQIPNVQLLIVGASLVDEGDSERAIAELGLAENVRREPDYVPSGRVGLYFAAADVVALPYRAASSSAALLNAYAHARPVVATTAGALAEMVDDGITGRLVPCEAPAAFAQALVELLRHPDRAAAMGQRARQYAASRHDWSLIARQTEAVYATLDRGSAPVGGARSTPVTPVVDGDYGRPSAATATRRASWARRK